MVDIRLVGLVCLQAIVAHARPQQQIPFFPNGQQFQQFQPNNRFQQNQFQQNQFQQNQFQQQQFQQNQFQQQQFQQQQQNRFAGQGGNGGFLPQFSNSPGTLISGAGVGLAGIFAAGNVLNGNDEINLRPQLGVNIDENGNFAPALGAAVQVGNGPVSPTFNVGGQFDQQGITPVVGGGLSVGNNNGGFNPAVNTGFALSNGQARPVVGAGAQVGSFNLNNLFG